MKGKSSSKIEKNTTEDDLFDMLYDNPKFLDFTSKKLVQMIKKRVTKQSLANYLKEVQFSGFGRQFPDVVALAAEYWSDYVRNWNEYDDIIWEDSFDFLTGQFTKTELINAVHILGRDIDLPPSYCDMDYVRDFAKKVFHDKAVRNDYYEISVYGWELDVIYAIADLFTKWFFPNNSMNGYRVPPIKKHKPVKRSTSPRVNVRGML